jgi:hypothetical protein
MHACIAFTVVGYRREYTIRIAKKAKMQTELDSTNTNLKFK